MKLHKSDPVFDFGPEPFSADGSAILAALKFGSEVMSRDAIASIADSFKGQWGEARAASALMEVIERVESVTGKTSHGPVPENLGKDDATLPATDADRQFRQTLHKGMVVAIVSRRPLDDGRIRVVVTHEKLVAVRAGTIRAKTKIQGRSARLTCGILLVYSTNKFPTELKRTFSDEGELIAWFSDLEEVKEEEQMMAANKGVDLRTWRGDARRGTRVEVHIVTAAGQKIQRGRILEPAKKGARLQMDEGNVSFKHWNEIFPEGWLELQPEAPKPKTLGKLGDVIDLKAASAKAPPVLKAPPTSQPGKATYTVVPPAAPKLEQKPLRPGRGGKLLPHVSTAIGNIFRSERLKRAWNQKQCAAFIGRTASTISDIELGDIMPDDDTLLQFSERFVISLDLLLSARDGKQEAAADPVLALHRIAEMTKKIAELEQEVSACGVLLMEAQQAAEDEVDRHRETKAGLRASEELLEETREKLDKATMPLDAQALQAVNEFIARLTAVSPVPEEPTKRLNWYEAALKMFGAGK